MSKELILSSLVFFFAFLCKGQQMDIDNGYEKGKAENGYKVGEWEYYGFDNSLELKIDYSKGTVVYLKEDSGAFLVKPDSAWRYEQVEPYPRYIGSYVEFYRILSSNLIYPLKARLKDIQKTVFLEFEIDTQGQAVNAKVLNDNENTLRKKSWRPLN
jgi:hypothetical protein